MKNLIIVLTIFSSISCGQKTLEGDNHQSNIDTSNIINTNSTSLPADTLVQIKPDLGKVEIASNWSLEDGWFLYKNLYFKKTHKEDFVFIFQKDGTIKYRTSKGFGDCPVGAFTMNDGKWIKEGQNLTLELRGLKISDYWYWWKVQYKIKELTADNLKLEVVKIIKNKEINPTLTWEDLMKE